jgi:hypothetical protein
LTGGVLKVPIDRKAHMRIGQMIRSRGRCRVEPEASTGKSFFEPIIDGRFVTQQYEREYEGTAASKAARP